ncbi:putative transposase, Ptta/En/Spm, plant [Helianthus annuus]|nr:putative transposase, Ptta/En/Spm, plant [Helianthus annuus]
MLDYRKESTKKARVAGHDFSDDRLDFEAMRKFPPCFVHLDVWDELCMGWNTEAWRKKSEKGRNNRKKVDNNDVISRHTGGGGSRGYDEHRIILERALGRSPTFRELFLATHLTKESKKDFWDGLFDESLEGLSFVQLDPDLHMRHTRDPWSRSTGKTSRYIRSVMLICGSVRRE